MSEKTSGNVSVAQLIAYVKTALGLKYSKPSGGIPASDLASNVITDISGKADKVAVTVADNGKFLRVVNGAWAAQAVPSAESNSFGGGS